MPFAVLLETALQPCGWLAAYVGSALTSEIDLSFRNLGGEAQRQELVRPDAGTLTAFGKELHASLDSLRPLLPPDLKIDFVADQPTVVADRVKHFIREFGIAIRRVEVLPVARANGN
jgi:hypothetical protein